MRFHVPVIILAAALAVVVPASRSASATPLVTARLPAKAGAIAHVDLDALRKLAIFRPLRAEIGKLEASPGYDFARLMLDTAHAASFWSTKDDAIALVVEVGDLKATLAALDRLPRMTSLTIDGRPTRRLAPDPADKDDEENFVALAGGLLVLTEDVATMRGALALLARKAPSLDPRKLPGGVRERGVFCFAAFDDDMLDAIKEKASSSLLQSDFKVLSLVLADDKGALRVRGSAVLGSAEDAAKLKAIVDGLVALASLVDEAKELRPVLQMFKVEVVGNKVEASVAVPAEMMTKLIAEIEQPNASGSRINIKKVRENETAGSAATSVTVEGDGNKVHVTSPKTGRARPR